MMLNDALRRYKDGNYRHLGAFLEENIRDDPKKTPKHGPQSTITSNPIANHAPKMVVEGEEGTRYGK